MLHKIRACAQLLVQVEVNQFNLGDKMKDYYAPDWWYEPDVEPEYSCHQCDEKDKEIDHMADHMKAIIEMLYGKDRLDVAMLEDHLDEVCHCLGLKLPAEMPNVERKRSEIFNFAVGLTREFAANLQP